MFPKLFFIYVLSSIFTHICKSQCVDHQKNLLLQLKHELIFNSSLSTKLVQWNHTSNCCHWYGVECDGAGHLISLQLNLESISGGITDSSSLFRLNHLEKLNLAYNNFNYAPLPKGIGNLTYLTHLNLSYAGFSEQVPLQLSWLRRLVSLDISHYTSSYISSGDFAYSEDIDPPKLKEEYQNLKMLVQNLSRLKNLYLDGVNIISSHERTNWSHIISSYLPNITTLSMVGCSLSGPLARSFGKLHSLSVLRLDYNDLSRSNPNMFANFSILTTLSLVDCNLKGSFPNKIFQIPTLQHLDLFGNEELSGSLPPYPQTGTLKSIRLRMTNFSGLIPTSIGNLKTLSEIDLSNCKFRGPIPSTFSNLTKLTYVDLSSNFFIGSLSSTMFEGFLSLVHLDLGINSITGNIPDSLFFLPSLDTLYLHDNKFIGVIEEFSTINVSNIVSLDLSNNRLEGPIPESFFQLQSLETLRLHGNSFSGAFQLDKIQNFANLTLFYLSNNNLSVHVGNKNPSRVRLVKLEVLRLASCKLNNFPDFIKHSDQMTELDLSNNRIGGEIPSWIWRTQFRNLNLSFNLLTHMQKPYHIPPSLASLDLQSNQLKGKFHLLLPPNAALDLNYLSLGNNSLCGSIPTSLCTATDLNILDLSVNKLSGNIPSCLLDDTMSLRLLDLGRNNLSGHIPDNFSLDCFLQYFDVNNNALEGIIPKSLKSCTSLELMNVGNNLINDTFPCMLTSSLRVLVMHTNGFHGEVKCHNNSWPNLQIIDISSNNFTGSLESVNFSSWRGMFRGSYAQFGHNGSGFNFSEGAKVGVRITMKGLELEILKIFPEFTTIDFSFNNFRGEIPKAIGDLSSLRLLNLSHNSLNGSMPKSFGKLGELESLDLSQNNLTGHIPTELSRLTFLSVLNVSYNELNGEIPRGRQLQTFSADSFLGNPGLCGFNLNKSCISPTEDEGDKNEKEKKKREVEWEYVSAALGYAVGLGSFVWLLIFCRRFRVKYFGKIDEVVEDIFDARDRRRRRRSHARRVERNGVVRRH